MDEFGTRLAESITDLLKDRHSKEGLLEKRLEALEQECREIGKLSIENKLLRDSFEKQNVEYRLLREEVEKLIHENRFLREELDRTNDGQRALQEELSKVALEMKTLNSLQAKFTSENDKMHIDLDKLNNEGKNLRDKFTKHLDELQQKITNCERWNSVISVIATEVKTLKDEKEDLKDWKDGSDDNLRTMDENVRQLMRQQQQIVQHQQQQQRQILQHQQLLLQQQLPPQQSNIGTYRVPVRSPSASSYLNGTHRRSTTKTSGYESLDPADDISELSDRMENLKREVDVMNELNQRYDGSSLYLDD